MAEWVEGAQKWIAGEHEPQTEWTKGLPLTYEGFAEYEGSPPDPEYYRPDWPEESRTHFQWYENVSEGTPLSPPFATQEELAQFIARTGDRVTGPVSIEQARKFVESEFAVSFIIDGGRVIGGMQAG
jgi:hypothetical protein